MNTADDSIPSNFLFLSAYDVAGWQLPSLLERSEIKSSCRAMLPALQRGAVWKPRQVEILWDSIVRGFPVGAFLLSPFRKELGTQGFKYCVSSADEFPPNYHLLDGQQRCNAITLGFLNVWEQVERDNPVAALWIDLDTEAINDERAFVFRVLTRSHPWGFQRSDPTKPLRHELRRAALNAYSKVAQLTNNDQSVRFALGKTSIRQAWPWEAHAPVPVPFLIEAVEDSADNVWQRVFILLEERLPYWETLEKMEETDFYRGFSWKKRLLTLLENPTPSMNQLVAGIRSIVNKNSSYKIPAIILQDTVVSKPGNDIPLQGEQLEDPVETLFIRVNSAGTPLQGEELNYSILKSIWPGAQEIVEHLSTGIMPPSRLVSLLSRLVLANAGRKEKKAPATPDVSRFRRLVHGRDTQYKNFLDDIQDYLESGKGKKLFTNAKELLTLKPEAGKTFLLPPTLMTEIARHKPETFFIMLIWLDRLMENGEFKVSDLSEEERRHLVGAVTSLAWFGAEPAELVEILWCSLQQCEEYKLRSFFSKGSLKDCIKTTESGKLPLIPILPPDHLRQAVDKALFGLGQGTNQKWEEWSWWKNFSGRLDDDTKEWYRRKLKKGSEEADDLAAWTNLVNSLWEKKELVLYAQREWIVKWFPDHDPASPDQLEDTDRPWDFDHIHPQKYVYGKWAIPQAIKDWHRSIGNIRAWPFELNRSDAESAPILKLKETGDLDNRFYVRDDKNALNASFVGEEWPEWEASTPKEGWFESNYLSNAKVDKYGECRVKLVRAITTRWVALYREWYDELLVKELFM